MDDIGCWTFDNEATLGYRFIGGVTLISMFELVLGFLSLTVNISLICCISVRCLCKKLEQKQRRPLVVHLIFNLTASIFIIAQGFVADSYDGTLWSEIRCRASQFTLSSIFHMSLLVTVAVILANCVRNGLKSFAAKMIIIFLLTLISFAIIPVLFLYEVHEYHLNLTNVEGFQSINFTATYIESTNANVTQFEEFQQTNTTSVTTSVTVFCCYYTTTHYTLAIINVMVTYLTSLALVGTLIYFHQSYLLEKKKRKEPRRKIKNTNLEHSDLLTSFNPDPNNTPVSQNTDDCPYNLPIRAILQHERVMQSNTTKRNIRNSNYIDALVFVFLFLLPIPYSLMTLCQIDPSNTSCFDLFYFYRPMFMTSYLSVNPMFLLLISVIKPT